MLGQGWGRFTAALEWWGAQVVCLEPGLSAATWSLEAPAADDATQKTKAAERELVGQFQVA
jgi:hypothetical protein